MVAAEMGVEGIGDFRAKSKETENEKYLQFSGKGQIFSLCFGKIARRLGAFRAYSGEAIPTLTSFFFAQRQDVAFYPFTNVHPMRPMRKSVPFKNQQKRETFLVKSSVD